MDMRCSLRDMSIFVAAYEERSFTAAAERENATQSGVSQHMRNLEYRLGVQLFLRERGGVTPTPAADSFYRNCLEVLRVHALARRDVARFAKSETGAIHVGLMPTITSHVLSPVLDRFLQEAPNVNVRITESYSASLTQTVQAGELDFAIVPSGSSVAGLRGRPFVRTPEVLVSRAGGDLEPLSPVCLRDLAPLKLVVPGGNNVRRHAIESYCTSNDIRICRMLELDTMLGTLDFVAQSDWVTILPAVMMARDGGHRALTVNPIVAPEMHVDLMLIEPIRRPMGNLATRFADLLREEAQHVSTAWNTEGLRLVKPTRPAAVAPR